MGHTHLRERKNKQTKNPTQTPYKKKKKKKQHRLGQQVLHIITQFISEVTEA